jgi:hypothetical protein
MGFHGHGVAEGSPEDALIAGGKPGKAGGGPARHLKKEDKIAFGDKADGKGAGPQDRRKGLHGPEHDELAGMPLPPPGQGKAQGVKSGAGVGGAEGNEIQNRFPAEEGVIHGISQKCGIAGRRAVLPLPAFSGNSLAAAKRHPAVFPRRLR